MIEQFARLIPDSLLHVSGSVFYSGRAAFGTHSKLYVLGLNPGGSPLHQSRETLAWHTDRVLNHEPYEWSAYVDEAWGGARAGAARLQRRVVHLLRQLDLEPRRVPSSNVAFVRSTREATLDRRFADVAAECWPFHREVIERLSVRVILCFGQTAGTWVANKLNARAPGGEFIEANNRRWRSAAFANELGISVVAATHPSIADWTAPATDPTPLVRSLLQQS